MGYLGEFGDDGKASSEGLYDPQDHHDRWPIKRPKFFLSFFLPQSWLINCNGINWYRSARTSEPGCGTPKFSNNPLNEIQKYKRL